VIEIKRWTDGKVLYTAENAQDVRTAVEEAVAAGVSLNDAELNGAKLNYAELNDAELNGAELNYAKLNYAKLNGAELNGAELNDAELNGAKLNYAELNYAELNYAELNGAELNGAASHWRHPLWPARQDFFSILDHAPAEVAALRQTMVDGRIEGSTYTGACSCLAGTIATAHGCAVGELPDELGIETDVYRPAEQWFISIREGDRPLDVSDESIDWKEQSEGVFRISWALKWLDEWVESRTAIAKALVPLASKAEVPDAS
jgi:pentapeptide repeat protein